MTQHISQAAANDAFGGEERRAPAPLHWTLLRARGQLPSHPVGLIPRQRLYQLLDASCPEGTGTGRASVAGATWYIWGQAGAGKSTLVRGWLGHRGLCDSSVWISLRAGDADGVRLLSLLEAALMEEEQYLEHRRKLSSQPGLTLEDRVWLLGQHLAEAGTPRTLVLDQVDVLASGHLLRLLAHLVASLPSQVQLMLIGRRPPPSDLERLEQLRFLEPRDLALDLDELRAMLATSGASQISEVMLEEMRRECHGWLQPVRLFAMHANREGALVSSLTDVPAVGRFIREQLLDSLPAEDQLALQALADAELLSDELVRAILSREESASNLNREQLLVLGIPLESASGQGAWYRLNGLFRTWLLRQAREGVVPRRLFLSKWFADRGDPVTAVHYAAGAGDHRQAIEIATACSESLLLSHNVNALARLRPMLSPQTLAANPRLCLVYAWVHAVGGQFSQAREMLVAMGGAEPVSAARKIALEAFIASGEGDLEQAETSAHQALARQAHLSPHAQVMILLVLSSVARSRNQFHEARDWNRRAAGSARQLADYGCESLAAYDHARIELGRGNLQRAMQLLQLGLEQSQIQAGSTPSAARSRLFLTQALIAWYRGEWELSERLLGQGLPEAEREADLSTLLGFCVRALLAHARGDSNAAFLAVGQGERLMQQWQVDSEAYQPILSLLKTSLWIADADADRARVLLPTLAGDGNERMPELFPMLMGLRRVLRVRALLKAGEVSRALDELAANESRQRHLPALAGPSVYGMLLKAHAFQLDGKTDKALQLLRQCLETAAEEGLISPFVELQQELAPLLGQVYAENEPSEFLARLRSCLRIELRAPETPQPAPAEAISDRERAVLELIAQGLSNQQIGDRLHISLHTVKTHARKINVKLGVRSRTQAIVRARALGYL